MKTIPKKPPPTPEYIFKTVGGYKPYGEDYVDFEMEVDFRDESPQRLLIYLENCTQRRSRLTRGQIYAIGLLLAELLGQ